MAPLASTAISRIRASAQLISCTTEQRAIEVWTFSSFFNDVINLAILPTSSRLQCKLRVTLYWLLFATFSLTDLGTCYIVRSVQLTISPEAQQINRLLLVNTMLRWQLTVTCWRAWARRRSWCPGGWRTLAAIFTWWASTSTPTRTPPVRRTGPAVSFHTPISSSGNILYTV